MPLQRKEAEIPLNGGLDLKQSTELQDVSSLRAVTNLRWDALGELRKRPTYASEATAAIPSGGDYESADMECIFTRESEVCALTKDYGVVTVDPIDHEDILYQRRDIIASGSPDSVLKYSPRACKVTRRFLERAQYGRQQTAILQTASAIYDGVMVLTWVEFGQSECRLWMKAVDVDSGTVIATKEYISLSASDITPAVCAIPYLQSGDEGVLITYATGSSAPYTISYVRYVAATRAFGSGGTLTSNAKHRQHAIADDLAGVTWQFLLSYCDNTANVMHSEQRTLASVVNTHVGTASNPNSFAIVNQTNNHLLISIVTSTAVYAERWGNPSERITLMSASSEFFYSANGSVEDPADQSGVVFVNCGTDGVTPSSYYTRMVLVDFSVSPVSPGSVTVIPHAWALMAAFSLDKRCYVPMGPPGAASVILSRYYASAANGFSRLHPVARIGHDRFCMFVGAALGTNYSVSVVDNKVHMVFTADQSADGALGSSPAPQSIFHAVCEFAADDAALPLPHAEVDGTSLVASGLLLEWDGESLSEHAPIFLPTIALDVTGGSGQTGTFSVVAVHRWVDAKGRLHRSAPSAAASTGVIANKAIKVYVSRPQFRSYDGSVTQALEPEVYITADGGTVYYLAIASGNAKAYYDTTDVLGAWFIFNSILAGSSSHPQLYSTGADGAEIVPEPPPSFRHITRIGDRMWAIDAEEPTRIWYTKPLVVGYAPEWSTVCTLAVGDNGVAIVTLGGNPTVLCESGVWQIYGAGPNANGVGEFSPAQRIASECSCIDPTSVCRTPLGVVFRGRRGFYAINDGGQLSVLGMPVDPTTRVASLSGYSPGRVIFDELHNEIRVLDSENGKHYVFNTIEQKWSEWTQNGASGQNIIDLAVCDGRVWYVHGHASGNLLRREYGVDETQDVSRSDENWSIQTPWIKVDGLAGFGRLWELILQVKVRAAGSVSDTVAQVEALTVTLETRSPEPGTDTFTWTGADLAALGTSDGLPVDLRMRVRNQRCKAFRVTVTESLGASDNYSGSSPVALRAVMGVDSRVKNTRTSAQKGST